MTRQSQRGVGEALGKAALAAAALVALAACDLPFGLGLPTVRELNSGAGDSLDAARSFRISGSYAELSTAWTVDLELVRPKTEHVLLSSKDANLEAIITDHGPYFRGRQFLASNLGSDPYSQSLVQAAGDSWWTGLATLAPQLPDFTNGGGFRATFLGTAVTSRTDHVSVGGAPAVELTGPRADVFLDEAPPPPWLTLNIHPSPSYSHVSNANFTYTAFGCDFGVAPPCHALDL